MKQAHLIGIALTSAVLLSSCAYPSTQSRSGNLRSNLAFDASTPGNAVVYVDGLEAGAVDEFRAGTNHLVLRPGLHDVRLISSGVVILDRRISLTDGAQLIISGEGI